MFNKWTVILMLFSFCQCDNSESINNESCYIQDTKIIGTWKLIEECNCYHLVGDFIWKNVSIDWTLSFDENCKVIEDGADMSICSNQGKYIITKDELTTKFMCPGDGETTNPYKYSMSANNDTLTLKGFVNEGYIGSKLLRQYE